jgi:tetratricopeptide (TPR) repeat protein
VRLKQARTSQPAKLKRDNLRDDLFEIYKALSALYKNPTKRSGGYEATDADTPLRELLEQLYCTFELARKTIRQSDNALYCKVLSLLFEVEDYLGNQPRVAKFVLDEYENIRRIIKRKEVKESETVDRHIRSLWKARIRCSLAALEIRRRQKGLRLIEEELNELESFCRASGLHRPELPAWTTLSLISVNYAKIAREQHNYELAKAKFNEATEYLYFRLCEILNDIALLRQRINSSPDEALKCKEELETLNDDLVFIKQKQTLASLFNLGLTSLQRGHLKRALHSCTAARLEFKLHGHYFHQLFNELLLLSIERGLTSPSQQEKFVAIEKKLQELVPLFQPIRRGTGHPKFYRYVLYELSIVQYYCNKMTDAERTLQIIEKLVDINDKWKSRIALVRSHIKRQQWKEKKQAKLLDESFQWASHAIEYANRGGATENEADAWLAKGRVYVYRHELTEARESAETALTLLNDIDNPKLKAMAYLVLARVCLVQYNWEQADMWLSKVNQLKPQVDHSYVIDKYDDLHRELNEFFKNFIIKTGRKTYNLFHEQEKMLGWMIMQVYHPDATISDIARSLQLKDIHGQDKRHIIREFIIRNAENKEYKHLVVLLGKPRRRKGK